MGWSLEHTALPCNILHYRMAYLVMLLRMNESFLDLSMKMKRGSLFFSFYRFFFF